uniref:Uncharacterized protein n=1 Tax=Pipistrellus kuhlii TaxID=59472 RepID=A0A7J7S6G6_PIPKU|nr:hypothetical protein mPipKuh1_010024 [Pipistrellus kuhlii]
MASLYQRFTGKINTSRSFPAPPEASRLLGGPGPEDEGAGPRSRAAAAGPRERGGAGGRPRFQRPARSDGEDEDVSFLFDYEPHLLVARHKTVVEVILAVGKTIAFTFAEPAQNVYYLAQLLSNTVSAFRSYQLFHWHAKGRYVLSSRPVHY